MSTLEPSLPGKYIVGLTGGIGSGKSAVAQRFAELGICVVDTDVISHELTAPNGTALAPLRASFGEGVFHPDGSLNRAALREQVFSQASQRKRLESILHPMIRRETLRRLRQAGGPYAMVVVPLLIESGAYRELCNRILVVDCEEATQVARTMQRSNLTESRVRSIMAAQASRVQRAAAADDILLNESSLDELHRQVDRLHDRYKMLAASAKAGR